MGHEMQLGLLDEAAPPDQAWRVRASERARRLAVRVLPGGLVEIVVPRGTRPRMIEQFVSRHRRWIERALDLYRPAGIAVSDVLPSRSIFRRSAGTIRFATSRAQNRHGSGATVSTIRLAGPLDRPMLLRHALQRFTMKEAHAMLGPWLSLLSAETGLRFEKVQIRRQRTRWGSCSRSGTISLNACLLFQPAPVVRYLLIHELAHTRHMNHSRRFWRLVERHEPGWRELDAALTRGWREVPAWALG